MDLSKRKLPNTIEVRGSFYSVYTDFRVWLRFANDFENLTATSKMPNIDYIFNTDRVPLILTAEDFNSIIEFYSPTKDIPRDRGGGEETLNYLVDGNYIYSAFYECYGIDLLEVNMHWHKFLALLAGISEETKLSKILGYRGYKGKDKEYKKLREIWRLPSRPLTAEEQAKIDEFDDYFSGKGSRQ